MFARSSRGLLDALAAALCLWVAAYQTPVGALARTAVARVLHERTTARPLLAYYSAGVYDAAEETGSTPTMTTPLIVTPPIAIPAGQALLYGVQAALAAADGATWDRVNALATSRGLQSPLPEGEGQGEGADHAGAPPHPHPSPQLADLGALHQLLDGLSTELGSPPLGVAALFCGLEVARFGRDRAQAQGRSPDLTALARVLPPSQAEALALASRAVAMGGAFALQWPVAEDTRITSPFGLRTHPILGTTQQHTGVDLSVPSGTEVHATGAGIVRRASEDAINGKVVIIDHGNGVTTAYCHNSELLVSAGDRVVEGQVISHSGTTGRSTGPHVHYQLELGGKPVDPLRFHRARSGPTSGAAID